MSVHVKRSTRSFLGCMTEVLEGRNHFSRGTNCRPARPRRVDASVPFSHVRPVVFIRPASRPGKPDGGRGLPSGSHVGWKYTAPDPREESFRPGPLYWSHHHVHGDDDTARRRSPGSRPGSPRRSTGLTLEQYEAMVDAGILGKRDRVHLIDGFLVAKMTQNDPHATADDTLRRGAHSSRAGRAGTCRAGKPIRIPRLTSRPEPDRSVVRRAVRDYVRRSPEPARSRPCGGGGGRHPGRRSKARWGLRACRHPALLDRQRGSRPGGGYSRPGPAGYEALEVLAPGHVPLGRDRRGRGRAVPGGRHPPRTGCPVSSQRSGGRARSR